MIKSRQYISAIRSYLKNIDWPLLVFLLLFLNVKVIVKLAAIGFIYFFRPSFKFGFSWKQSRLPLFYLCVILIGLLNYFLTGGFKNINYTIAFSVGILFWLLSILSIHQVKLSVEQSPKANVYKSLFIFFMLNVTVSGIQLLRIIIETGEWNPYTYQGLYQKYFIGTGDYIKGITFDTSTTNAVLNAFGVFFFLIRKQFAAMLLCMTALLLTCSNFINLTVLLVFIYSLFFQSSRAQKSMITVCFVMLVLFMAKVSPQNNDYAMRTFEKIFKGKVSKKNTILPTPVELRPDSTLTEDEKKYKFAKLQIINAAVLEQAKNNKPDLAALIAVRPKVPVANIHSAPFQHKQDSSAARLQVISFAMHIGRDTSTQRINAQKLPGKLLAVKQTFNYLSSHPEKIFLGAGIGNFSSKLAFRTTGLQVAGGYLEKYLYVNDDFRNNQLAIFLDYFGKDSGFHSITNSPNNVYVQLLAEYGVAGLLSFFIFYGWFFAKGAKRNSYAIPVLLVVGSALFVEYWFEQLSVLVVFELLMFMHKKEVQEASIV